MAKDSPLTGLVQLVAAEPFMKLCVYSGRTCFILVPDFLLPPPATALYTPLTFQGFIDEEEIPAQDLQIIRSAITRSYYAIVSETVVDVWSLSRTA